MVTWDRVTRADVLRAIEAYDGLGPERFFSEHGYAPTTTLRADLETTALSAKGDLGYSL
jgi:hypothetical protein